MDKYYISKPSKLSKPFKLFKPSKPSNLSKLLTHKRFKETFLLGLLSMFCLSLTLFRFYYTGSKVFIFLNWNLFLAFIPWFFTSLLILKPSINKSRFLILLILSLWLLFFPNAPYILTDLFHLKFRRPVPIWYDLLLILSFAWTGLLFGFLSLWDLEYILSKKIKPIFTKVISSCLLFLASFGVYLGRFLRWNSWEVVTNPNDLFVDIGDRVLHPFEHPKTWAMTILMGFILNIMYWSISLISNRQE